MIFVFDMATGEEEVRAGGSQQKRSRANEWLLPGVNERPTAVWSEPGMDLEVRLLTATETSMPSLKPRRGS